VPWPLRRVLKKGLNPRRNFLTNSHLIFVPNKRELRPYLLAFSLISVLNEGEMKLLFHVLSCLKLWEKLVVTIILFLSFKMGVKWAEIPRNTASDGSFFTCATRWCKDILGQLLSTIA